MRPLLHTGSRQSDNRMIYYRYLRRCHSYYSLLYTVYIYRIYEYRNKKGRRKKEKTTSRQFFRDMCACADIKPSDSSPTPLLWGLSNANTTTRHIKSLNAAKAMCVCRLRHPQLVVKKRERKENEREIYETEEQKRRKEKQNIKNDEEEEENKVLAAGMRIIYYANNTSANG